MFAQMIPLRAGQDCAVTSKASRLLVRHRLGCKLRRGLWCRDGRAEACLSTGPGSKFQRLQTAGTVVLGQGLRHDPITGPCGGLVMFISKPNFPLQTHSHPRVSPKLWTRYHNNRGFSLRSKEESSRFNSLIIHTMFLSCIQGARSQKSHHDCIGHQSHQDQFPLSLRVPSRLTRCIFHTRAKLHDCHKSMSC